MPLSTDTDHPSARTSQRSRFLPIALAWAGLCLALPGQAGAIEGIELALGSIEAEDWRAEGVSLGLDWDRAAGAGYRISIDKLTLPTLGQSFEGVKVDCRQGEVSSQRILCEVGVSRKC